MITSDGMLEVQEIESGTYIFPNSKKFASTWALFVYSDGRAELYMKRNLKTGALLGKPINLGEPIVKGAEKIQCTDSACPLMGFQAHEFGKDCRLY